MLPVSVNIFASPAHGTGRILDENFICIRGSLRLAASRTVRNEMWKYARSSERKLGFWKSQLKNANYLTAAKLL